MDNLKFRQFIKYYHNNYINSTVFVNHLYEKFGREFIHSLPVQHACIGGDQYTLISGTTLMHSVTEPAYVWYYPRFCILGIKVDLDSWLPLSALSPEEQILFKLKYV